MEFIGPSLCLPLTEESNVIVNKALTIYKRWLGMPTIQPNIPVPNVGEKNLEMFHQTIIVQLSSVFERPGKAPKPVLDIHCEYCKEVARIYGFIEIGRAHV